MNRRSPATFKKLLEHRRQELLRLTESVSTEGRRLAKNEPQDLGDQSAAAASRELLFQQGSQNRQEVRLLETALHRIEAGTFGQCKRCGQEIGTRRLAAVPSTVYCIDCQRSIEQESADLRSA